MNRTIVLSSIAIISLLAFVAANRADKVVTLEDRVKDLEDRIANLEQSMFATATLSVMDAERRLDQAKTAVRESQKLHNRGILNTSRLDQDRFELERAQRELELAKSSTGGRRISLEIRIMEATQQVAMAQESLSFSNRLLTKGYISKNEVNSLERGLERAEKALQFAKDRLIAFDKSVDLKSKKLDQKE